MPCLPDILRAYQGGRAYFDSGLYTLAMIAFYQRWISPLFPNTCRFHPSCLQYAYEAIAKYGLRRGGSLAAWRLLRCNPYNKGGFDYVP